jgi:hypothetical protein
MSSGDVEDEQLISHRAAATTQRAGYEISILTHRCRAETLASRGQRRECQPPVRLRIVGFILKKSVTAAFGIGFLAFAAGV